VKRIMAFQQRNQNLDQERDLCQDILEKMLAIARGINWY